VQQGRREACDDGVNDGAYGGCAVDCKALAPYCGDGVVQSDYEECDEADPTNGLHQGELHLRDELQRDPRGRARRPRGARRRVLDQAAGQGEDQGAVRHGRGRRGLHLPQGVAAESEAKVNASEAEGMCKTYGMHLLVPRSPAHAAAAVAMAKSTLLVPVGHAGTVKASSTI
jgi:hypothetical protein